MYEGKGYGAETFYFNYYVFVFTDSAGVAFIAGERSGYDAETVADLVFLLMVDFAAKGVGGGEEAEEAELLFGNWGDLFARFVAVDPERWEWTFLFSSFLLDGAGLSAVGMEE